MPDTTRPRLRRGLVRLVAAGLALAFTAWTAGSASSQGGKRPETAPAAPAVPTRPGVPAPAQTVDELRHALADVVRRLEARDTAGVLAYVSEQYRTTPLTKPVVRDQLLALFGLYDTVRARARIDEVRVVGEQAWVWSTGEVTGRLALVRQWMPVLSWERELEVARRENGRWRLYGYQQ